MWHNNKVTIRWGSTVLDQHDAMALNGIKNDLSSAQDLLNMYVIHVVTITYTK